ncbi:transcription initiation factor IIB [Halocatena marina]|uniref:Transcription initiation factor IIB n=1 Tax=Halocatena marina TaxID=2934937 RepID=A0ABD5YLK5_9EURY|nr:transcription initiation factor IIB [Halocatena marina]
MSHATTERTLKRHERRTAEEHDEAEHDGDHDTEHVESGRTECPECGSTSVVQEQGERCCGECGLVVEDDLVDRGPEWRAFDSQERNQKSRVGAPTTHTMHDKGLTTDISWKNKDAYGQFLSTKKRNQMNRLRKWHDRLRTVDNAERNLRFALSEIDRMASALGVPKSVREVASVIYRRALSEDLIRGRSIEGVATATLYAACRQEGIPRSLDEVTEVARIDRREIARTYRHVSQNLGLELKPADPKQYVPRFCSDLDLSEEVQTKANEIIDVTAGNGLLSGKSPTGYAAAAIYAASLLCNEKRTQNDIASVAQVTEVTIRNRYQEQIKEMNIVA